MNALPKKFTPALNSKIKDKIINKYSLISRFDHGLMPNHVHARNCPGVCGVYVCVRKIYGIGIGIGIEIELCLVVINRIVLTEDFI